MSCKTNTTDRILLSSGGIAALLFCGIATYEMSTRPGFDIRRHATSMLSLGDRGWIMAATFIGSGVLTLLCAAGLSRVVRGSWLAFLIGIYGLGLIAAGIFPAPASFGFPPGTPDQQLPVMTGSAIIHSMSFMLAFTSLTIACFVAARHLSGVPATSSRLAGIAMPVLVVLGMMSIIPTGIAFYVAAIVGWGWLALIVMSLAEASPESGKPAKALT